jgi:hypothetical protein
MRWMALRLRLPERSSSSIGDWPLAEGWALQLFPRPGDGLHRWRKIAETVQPGGVVVVFSDDRTSWARARELNNVLFNSSSYSRH